MVAQLQNDLEVSLERYETLIEIRADDLIKGKYTVFERDVNKGLRICQLDATSGAVYREDKSE